jgi:Protein of unknown function (DUF3987)
MTLPNSTSNDKGNGHVTVARLARQKRLPADFLRSHGVHDLPNGRGVGITYYDITGLEIVTRPRTALAAKDGSSWPKGQAAIAYGQQRLHDAQRLRILLIVEGESDCWALWHHGMPALGLPGSSTSGCLQLEHLDCIDTVYVSHEPDKGGQLFVDGLCRRLAELGFAGKVFDLRMPSGIKDPCDLHVADAQKFPARLQVAIEASQRLTLPHVNGKAAPPRPTPEPEPWQPPVPLTEEPDVEPFPITTLPARLVAFVEDVAHARGCPTDYVAVPVLALAGAAIGARRALEVKVGWRERPCLYAAVIGPPGSAKTPALSAVAAPVYAEQTRRMDDYRPRKELWRREGGEKSTLPKPVLQSVFVSDITTEKLACLLQENPLGLAIIRDELAGWVAGMDQYKAKGKGGDRQFFLSAWAGEPVRVDRKNQDEPLLVPHPFVAVIGGLPPALLTRLRGERGIADGFFDRILFSYPTPLPVTRETWACISEEAAASWSNVLTRLWDLKPESTSDGGTRPHFVYLTVEGRRAWERFTEALAADLNREEVPDPIKGHLAKFKGYGARLALIVHCLRLVCGEATDENVDGESVDRAARLVAYFHSHCLKVHAALGSDTKALEATRLWKWIQQRTELTFTRRDAYRAMRGRVGRVDDLDPLLALLVKHGYVRPVDVSRPGPGRRPSELYEVNPLDKGLNGRNGQNSEGAGHSVHSVHSVPCPRNREPGEEG